MATKPVKVPDIGESDSVEIIEVLVSVGDTVAAEQSLITLESDKATLEVPAPEAGTIAELKVSEGSTVSEGDVIAEMTPAESDSAGDHDAPNTDSENAQPADDSKSGPQASTDNTTDGADRDNGAGGGGDASGGQAPIQVPDIGDAESVEVIEVLVATGDTVAAEQPLITLESDKATLEVPAPTAGSIVAMTVAEGDTVSAGDAIGTLEQSSSNSASSSQSGSTAQTKQEATPSQPTENQATTDKSDANSAQQAGASRDMDSGKVKAVDENGFLAAHASPSVRRFARQLGADLGQIAGSGRKGRILQEDVESFVKQTLEKVQSGGSTGVAAGAGLPTQPDIDFNQFGETETTELSRIRKISAKAVHDNWLMIPHVTQFESADITDMEAFRQANKDAAKAEGVKLTPLTFLLKAAAAALKAFPDLNSSLTADGEHLVHKKYVNIAVAVDTPNGLLMPVIKDVDKKGIYDIARDLDDVSTRARDGKIRGDDMKGACFSISSLGGVGGQAFTPIVNSPEVGILGVSKHSWQPVWQNGEFVPRLMLPLSFSYDHRVIDGAEAARITNFLSRALGDLRTLLL
ncbi:dihydrolipoyllysine-residue acetyltransferase [Salinisphaera sp. USBA-960]|nr:dihydrolipoyllysine-residue acetyltransferase [Salifodinibacter halophilus]NNC25334.1 dihydrolipoyllysine-residue acetyltransferase [Salifodinibacter halophilus]